MNLSLIIIGLVVAVVVIVAAYIIFGQPIHQLIANLK